MSLRYRFLALFALFAFAFGGVDAQAARRRGAVKSAGYDWDENTMFMKTLVFLMSKHGLGQRAITTVEYAHEKKRIGVSGAHADYVIDSTPLTGSFRNTSDANPGQFARDVAETIRGAGWEGPSWSSFVKSLSTRDGARRVSIITAREHTGSSIYEGLKVLKAAGLIRYLPNRKRLFGVGLPNFSIREGEVLAPGGAKRKTEVQRMLLDKLQADFARTGRRQAWTYSDDDWLNYSTAVEGLRKDVAEGRWPGVSIELKFTGGSHAEHPPEVTLL